MNTSRRVTVVTAVGGLLLSMLVSCSSGKTAAHTSLGAVDGISPAPTTSPTGAPKPAPTPTTAPPTTATPTVTATVTTTATTSASPGGHITPSYILLLPNYALNTKGFCYWRLYNDGGNYLLQVGATFTISTIGLITATTVPFQLTIKGQAGQTSGDEPIGPAFTPMYGTNLANSSNAYLNKTIKITGTIAPIGTDSVPTDNAITLSIQVPDASHLPTDFDLHALTCT